MLVEEKVEEGKQILQAALYLPYSGSGCHDPNRTCFDGVSTETFVAIFTRDSHGESATTATVLTLYQDIRERDLVLHETQLNLTSNDSLGSIRSSSLRR